ncbi:M14 family zinc carboxypeptidase [Streptomyces mirabilis]|uniref:M14 family zinc carboxypeptidase n=1 Tax=Streptomyces mirabilis TaxID=68239 RepID=UPI00331C9DBA
MDDRYQNVDEVETLLSNIARANPSTCELITLGNLTHDGRTCHAIRLSSAAAGNRPIILLTGGVHAREWGSCEILINFISDFLRAWSSGTGLRYGNMAFSAEDLQIILNRIDILVFPLVNPDGRHWSMIHQYDREAGKWRKNRRPPPDPDRNPPPDPKCWGVDINRNFDFLFDFERAFSPAAVAAGNVSVSKNPCHFELYQGPEAFSEPETRNVRSLLDSHPPIQWLVDLHSFSEDVLFPWGDDNTQSTDPTMNFRNAAFDGKRGIDTDLEYAEFCDPADLDSAKTLAQSFSGSASRVRGTLYGPFPSYDLYPTCGVIDDYAYSRHLVDPNLGKVIGATVEWGREFQPPWEEMKLIIADVTAGLLGVCLHVANETTPPSPGIAHGIPAMIQSVYFTKDIEFVTPLAEGGIDHWRKHYDQPGESTFWNFGTRFAKTEAVAALSMIQSSFGPGNLELVARIGFRIAHFWCDPAISLTWHGPIFLPQLGEGGTKARGNPALIQSSFGPDNLEVVTPMAGGGLAHFWRGDPNSPWHGPNLFGGDELVDAVSMTQSLWDVRPLVIVARINDRIVQYSRATTDSPWVGPTTIIDPDTAHNVNPVGNPVLIQRGFAPLGENNNERGQLELVTPMTDGTLAHFTQNSPLEPWSSNPSTFGHEQRPFDAVTAIERWTDLGMLDVIARTSSRFRRFIRDQSGWREDPQSSPAP